MKTEIGIAGNSGCEVSLKHKEQGLVIEKSTSDMKYIPRLKRQIELQQTFQQQTGGQIIVPRILDQQESTTTYAALMEYLPFLDFTEFYGRCSALALKRSADYLIEFVRSNLSSDSYDANKLMLSKLEEISEKVDEQRWGPVARQSLERLTSDLKEHPIALPRGRCHGDLTLSNMLFSKDGQSIGLIDFLDSYLESPVIDLVKIRQDTHLRWSFVKTNKTYSRARLNQALDYLDSCFIQEITKFISCKTYSMLQGVNILRILPYAQDRKTLEFIHSALLKLEA